MINIIKTSKKGLSDNELYGALTEAVSDCRENLKKVLLIPPDYTRYYSGAGKITAFYYKLLKDTCQVDVLPALGTHFPMTEEECEDFFEGEIPFERLIVHNWKTDVVKIGEVPADYINQISEGLVNNAIDVEVNKVILDKSYDLILSIGQVVPHEVVGMANHNKNIFVGCGGNSMINNSHMLGAFYGMERIMGKDHSPVRKVFDYAEEKFLMDAPIFYVLTVTTQTAGKVNIHGLFIGRERKYFEEAVKLSQQTNLEFVDDPFKKVVVYLEPKEFRSTWLGNKAVYRTRMAIADGGELIILAPGIRQFGEDPVNDELIRKYGYVGRVNVLKLCEENDDLKNNLSVAAHLIHGSSDDRFSITYCTKLISEYEVRGAAFNYMPYDEAVKLYDPEKLIDGYNTLPNGEKIYYISNPALGLWADKNLF
ncbi:MAG: DUF2088 domain-containing protein [Clostridiales bacterium]|nr:DUF2088 domain-containing protein [Clostridiales bacterium]